MHGTPVNQMSYQSQFATLFMRHLRKGHLRSAGIQILAVAIVMLLCGMVLLGANVKEMRRGDERVQQSNAMLVHIAEMGTEVLDVEMSVRGYALTGYPEFRVYNAREQQTSRQLMQQLSLATAGDAEQARRYATLKTVMTRRMTMMNKLLALDAGHAGEISGAIVNPQVRGDRFTAVQMLSEMREHELTRLKQRQETARRQAEQSYDLAIGIVVTAFLLSAAGLLLAQGGLQQRES